MLHEEFVKSCNMKIAVCEICVVWWAYEVVSAARPLVTSVLAADQHMKASQCGSHAMQPLIVAQRIRATINVHIAHK